MFILGILVMADSVNVACKNSLMLSGKYVFSTKQSRENMTNLKNNQLKVGRGVRVGNTIDQTEED